MVSNESVIVQIFDPLNVQLSIDQFLATSETFDKQYLADGVLWKLDGKYTVRSTYLKNSVESTFDFTIPDKTISVPEKTVVPVEKDPVNSIASFVDSEKDPQYYVDRYNNEASYKEWFDKNYPQYDSIYDAVGLMNLLWILLNLNLLMIQNYNLRLSLQIQIVVLEPN